MTNEEIRSRLNNLRLKNVSYLDFDNYNEEDDNNSPYRKDYVDLFNSIIVDRLFKHFNIMPENNNCIFNFFEYYQGQWYATFYEPYVSVPVNTILKNEYNKEADYNELANVSKINKRKKD